MPPQLSLAERARIDDVEQVPDHTILWRLIDPEAVKTDPQTNERTASDGQFRTQEMSVRIRVAERLELADLKRENPGALVAELVAEFVRGCGCIITLDKNDPSHAFVYRKDKPGKRISSSSAARLARGARFV